MKNFADTFHKIVSAERKKLARARNCKDVSTAEEIMSLPYIAKNYKQHRETLTSINKAVVEIQKTQRLNVSKKVSNLDYDNVFNAVQFFQVLIDLHPSPTPLLIRDEIPEAVIDTGRLYIIMANASQTPHAKCPYARLFVEIFLFLAQLTLVDCSPAAVGRPLDRWITALVFDLLYSSTFKPFIVDIPEHSVSSGSDGDGDEKKHENQKPVKAEPDVYVSLISLYSVWILRNISQNTRTNLSFIANHKPLAIIFHLIFQSIRNYCSCCSPQHHTLTVKHGLKLVKNISASNPALMAKLFHKDSLCELCIRLIQKIWLKCSGTQDIMIEAFDLLSTLTDTGNGSNNAAITSEKFINHVLQVGIVKNLLEFASKDGDDNRYMAVRVIGNLAAQPGVKGQQTTQALIDAGVISCFFDIVKHCSDYQLCKEACWSLSNLCAGTPLQACQTVGWNNFEGFKIFLECMSGASFPQARREAAWAVINTCHYHESKFQPLLWRFSVLTYLCKYCYLQMAQYGHILGRQVSCILSIFNTMLCERATTPTTTFEQREEIANILPFLAMFVPDAQQQVTTMIETHFPARWTNIESMD